MAPCRLGYKLRPGTNLNKDRKGKDKMNNGILVLNKSIWKPLFTMYRIFKNVNFGVKPPSHLLEKSLHYVFTLPQLFLQKSCIGEKLNISMFADSSTLVFETFLECGKLQCKLTFNRKQVCLHRIEQIETNKLVLYLPGDI